MKTYIFNGQSLPLNQLPADLQAHILQAEDFYNQLDEATSKGDRAEVERILATHPHNQV